MKTSICKVFKKKKNNEEWQDGTFVKKIALAP